MIKSYKGFNADMTCRGFQFELGKEYTHEGEVKACLQGFHACEYPLDVLQYYPPNNSVYAEVEQDGTIAKHNEDSKVASSVLRIKATLSIADMIKAAIDYTFSRSKPEGLSATGEQGAASATGVRGAASATGWQGAASATGEQGAASATGVRGAASATGVQGKVMGVKGCALFLAERNDSGKIISAAAAIVGKNGIKPNVWYTLKRGKFVVAKDE